MEGNYNKKEEALAVLIGEVEETFGRRILSSRDCIQLSEDIFARTSFKINSNTLRRVFRLVKAAYPPSASTVDILSRYCGFESFDELLAIKRAALNTFELCKDNGVLDFMVSLFKTTNIREANDETFLALVKSTIHFLQRNPELIEKFQRAIAKTRNGQEFYFEQFVNIDKLDSYYGDGIRYYLNEKKTTEALIFGHSLMCLRAWLRDDVSSLNRHFEEVSRQNINLSMHPFVCGRYYASHIYQADMNGLDKERILINALHTHGSLKPGMENYRLFPAFEYVYSWALVNTGLYEEALYYIDYALEKYPYRHSYVDPGYYKSLQLIRGLALFHTGHKDESEEIFNNLRPAQFYFLTKKINTMHYLILKNRLNRGNEKSRELFDSLVMETGFKRLKRFMSKNP